MDRLKKMRTPVRASFTRTLHEVRQELAEDSPDEDTLSLKLAKLEKVMTDLRQLDSKYLESLLDDDCSDEDYSMESEAIEGYEDRLAEVRRKVGKALAQIQASTYVNRDASVPTCGTDIRSNRTFTLPKIELNKFNGELTGWLTFWSQFKKVHEDTEIHDCDKFQYLVQSMVSGTRASELVNSYPQSGENYARVIVALKERFGKEDLLIEVYVRELLKLVISNVSNKERPALSSIFDKIEGQLRALDTLGLTTDKCAAVLFPLVESSLPDETLRAWLRSSLSSRGAILGGAGENRLSCLMEFLKREVESEVRIDLAKSGFVVHGARDIKKGTKPKHDVCDLVVPTAAGLFNGDSVKCVFCEKHHESRDCVQAQHMSIVDKKHKLTQHKRCFTCLRPNHVSKKCKAVIRCSLCAKKHLVLMCPELPSHKSMRSLIPTSTSVEKTVQSSMSNQICTSDIVLMTLLVDVVTNGESKTVRALIDTGSQRSYVLKSTAEQLGLVSHAEETIIHSLFGGTNTEPKSHDKFRLQLSKPGRSSSISIDVLSQSKICGKIPRVATGEWMNQLRSNRIWVSDIGKGRPADIELLIGADAYGQILTGRLYRLDNGMTAVETELGWTLMGRIRTQAEDANVAMLVTSMKVSDASVAELWELESIGISDPIERVTKEEAAAATKDHFRKTVSRTEEGRYVVALPWIDGHPPLPTNREVAGKRLVVASNKLKKEGKLELYGRIFKDWLQEGIIEEVPDAEIETPSHYLPHRPVFKPDSLTTPVRPVFDASSKCNKSPSLNDCLEKGSNLIELIPSMITRFREKKIGVTSDIRKAFLMIEIHKKDRDFLRFLWWESDYEAPFKVFRHKRVVFGLNCSPFLLGSVIDYHLNNQVPEDKSPIAKKLQDSLYVDNCVTSVNTVEEVRQFREESVKLFEDAKMDLRMWKYSKDEDSEMEDDRITSVLGLNWDRHLDSLSVVIPSIEPVQEVTKRTILSMTQKIFDPLGICCPVILLPKLMLQEMWISKMGWDVLLDEESTMKFRKWLNEIRFLSNIKIPRHIANVGSYVISQSFHTFCDASGYAYAAVVFLRTESTEGVTVQLLQAKSRIAPLKKSTIPRLELMSCLIGSRLSESVQKSLHIEDKTDFHFWSDSTTALAWIRRNDEWGTFVGNRVKEICNLTKPENWRHVPGSFNPADLPSRGCSSQDLLRSRWWEGPEWLKDHASQWPVGETKFNEELVFSEQKKKVMNAMHVTTGEDDPWNITRFSSYTRLVKVTAWMKRFINKSRKKTSAKGALTVDELNAAEKDLLVNIQQESFCSEGEVACGLQVFKGEDGLLRVKTRLAMKDDIIDFIFPVLLPSKHLVVNMIIREEHLKNSHAGVQFLMGKLREKYWIVKSRQTIKSICLKCPRCRRFAAKRSTTYPAPLPQDRVTTAAVFQIVGVDLAGPMYLKDKSKVWLVLFTCAVYRAIHLELVSSLSTEAFIQSVRRFVARRGRPSTVYSDNATNFVGCANALQELDWDKVKNEFAVDKIHWKFNPPSAAWWGGWWERLIRSVKGILRRVLGKSSLNYEELSTVLCDAEAVINGRPLTYITDNIDDLIPLTPAMFLNDIREQNVPDLDMLESEGFQRRFRYRQVVRDHLRSRFRKEYLGQLVQRGKASERHRKLSVGEIVLVGADNKKRLDWPMAKVLDLLPGKDGYVRVARVKTQHGILVRPIQRLYPLEVSNLPDLQRSEDDAIRTRAARVMSTSPQ